MLDDNDDNDDHQYHRGMDDTLPAAPQAMAHGVDCGGNTDAGQY